MDCWVHVDKKSTADEFRKSIIHRNVYFVTPSQSVEWGCFSTVEAMLYSLKQVTEYSSAKYDYINFLSGQDYPLQQPSSFLHYLDINEDYEYMGITPYQVSSDFVRRIHKYDLRSYSFPGKILVERILNKLISTRKFPYDFDIRKGPQWITITRSAACYFIDFVSKNPAYINYFRKVHIADEFFFQTILFNSSFKGKIIDKLFHYTDWSEYKSHPKLLTVDDYNQLTNSSDCFFARKFDMNIDVKILDLLDKFVNKAN